MLPASMSAGVSSVTVRTILDGLSSLVLEINRKKGIFHQKNVEPTGSGIFYTKKIEIKIKIEIVENLVDPFFVFNIDKIPTFTL